MERSKEELEARQWYTAVADEDVTPAALWSLVTAVKNAATGAHGGARFAWDTLQLQLEGDFSGAHVHVVDRT